MIPAIRKHRTALGTLAFQCGLDPDRILLVFRQHLSGAGGELLHRSRHSTLTVHPGLDGGEVVLKSFGRRLAPGPIPAFRGRRAWFGAWAFVDAGLPTPEPIAYLERRGFPQGEGLLMVRRIPQALPLDVAWRDRIARGLPAERRAFVRALAASYRQLAESGIYHPDLAAKNVLVSGEAPGWRFHYIDLDGVRSWRKPNSRRKAKNLAQLAHLPIRPSSTDCLRFLQAAGFEGEELLTAWNRAGHILEARYLRSPMTSP